MRKDGCEKIKKAIKAVERGVEKVGNELYSGASKCIGAGFNKKSKR